MDHEDLIRRLEDSDAGMHFPRDILHEAATAIRKLEEERDRWKERAEEMLARCVNPDIEVVEQQVRAEKAEGMWQEWMSRSRAQWAKLREAEADLAAARAALLSAPVTMSDLEARAWVAEHAATIEAARRNAHD